MNIRYPIYEGVYRILTLLHSFSCFISLRISDILNLNGLILVLDQYY